MKQRIVRFFGNIKHLIFAERELTPEQREQFTAEQLDVTRYRTRLLMVFMIFFQVVNFAAYAVTRIYEEYKQYFLTAAGALLVTSIFTVCILRPSFCEKLSTIAYKNLILLCWALTMAATGPFLLGDFLATQSIINYILFMLGLAVLPTIGSISVVILFEWTLAIAMGVVAGLDRSIMPQIVLMGFLTLYIYVLRIASAVTSFREKLQLSELADELARLSETDQLTGLLNRRGLVQHTAMASSLMRRTERNIGLLLIDIDYFKMYNDKYLHQQGDVCLHEVAQCIKQSARRASDIVARYGGEEFALVFCDVDEDSLLVHACRIRADVEAMKIPFGYKDFEYVSISIGVALEYPGQQETDEEFFSRTLKSADQQLYHAKASGRNCVSFSENIHR